MKNDFAKLKEASQEEVVRAVGRLLEGGDLAVSDRQFFQWMLDRKGLEGIADWIRSPETLFHHRPLAFQVQTLLDPMGQVIPVINIIEFAFLKHERRGNELAQTRDAESVWKELKTALGRKPTVQEWYDAWEATGV